MLRSQFVGCEACWLEAQLICCHGIWRARSCSRMGTAGEMRKEGSSLDLLEKSHPYRHLTWLCMPVLNRGRGRLWGRKVSWHVWCPLLSKLPSSWSVVDQGKEEKSWRIPITDKRLNSSMLRPMKPFARRLGVTLIVGCCWLLFCLEILRSKRQQNIIGQTWSRSLPAGSSLST